MNALSPLGHLSDTKNIGLLPIIAFIGNYRIKFTYFCQDIKIEIFLSVLYYIFEHDNPIDDGQTIAGLENGDMNPDIKWKVQYEDSLIQPVRTVIDINMGEYASGTR